MGKSSELLRKALKAAVDSKKITITELEKITKIPRPSFYGYLKGAVPDLDSLDKIAEALGYQANQLITEDGHPPVKAHSVKDCYDSIGKALGFIKDNGNHGHLQAAESRLDEKNK